ncbi:hypothetical protein DYB37_004279 [Aphanomyces astaci]|uniref:Gem-associated protein 5 TPR domain-containing protein n=1 Tax=Aphanomyces astaci TaxID=112090 RepID=A0A3R7B4J9_APHAT|nr:hypothetical protein DYB37_004279 [Aphanomyces astaci]
MQRKGFNNLHVVGGDVNGKYFAFCSTLAVYVYDITSFQLHRLLSTADNLAGLAWCLSPQHGHWLATVSLSQKVVLYDVETEQILYDVLLPYHPVSFQWHPSSLQLVVATSDPSGKTSAASTLVGWTIDHTNRSTSVTTLQRGNTGMLASPSAITVIRFNTAGTLAIGNGNLAIYTAKSPTLRLLDKKKTSKKQSTGAPPGSPTANAIIDLQWDPLSTIYLLIATRDGHCALWEVTDDTGTPLHTFDKQGSGTSAVAWLPWGSGLFVTANARTGNLKLWNPLSAQVLATCGHDGAVRVWNTSTMECTHHLQPHDVGGIAYSVAWSPSNANRLVSASSLGTVYVWDLAGTLAPASQLTHHTDAVYCVAWRQPSANNAKSMLASSSKDKSVVIFYDAVTSSASPSREAGHLPLYIVRRYGLPCTFQKQQRGDDQAADGGSDDTAERSSHCSQPWSRTPPPLLLSGSWDGTIRIWDVERRECCVVVSDHLADVYGIATHPQAPSVFVSCSRDTTVRFWGLTTSATDQVVLRTMLQMTSESSSREEMAELAAVVAAQSSAASSGVTNLMGLLQENHMRGTKGSPSAFEPAKTTTTTATMVVPAEGRLLAVALEHARRLECGHGRRSKPTKLNQRDTAREAAIQYLKAGAVQKYCQLLVDVDEWEAALAMAPAVSIEFWQQLAAKYADVLQAKQDEAAVMYYLATQQVAKAVDVLQGRGQFNDACVVAKAHTKIHDVVAATPPLSGSLDCGTVTFPPVSSPSPHFETASPNPKAVVLTTRFNTVDDQVKAKDVEDDNCSTPNANMSAHEVAATRLLHKTFTWLADLYSDRGEPVLAACCHLAVAQVLDAIDRLVRGDEVRQKNSEVMALVYVRLNRPKELQELAQVANVEKLEESLEAFVSTCQAIEMATTHLQAALSTSSLSVASSPTVSQKQLLLDVTPRALTLAYMALAGALRAMDARYPLVLVSYLMQLVHTQVHSYNVPFPVATTKLLLLVSTGGQAIVVQQLCTRTVYF